VIAQIATRLTTVDTMSFVLARRGMVKVTRDDSNPRFVKPSLSRSARFHDRTATDPRSAAVFSQRRFRLGASSLRRLRWASWAVKNVPSSTKMSQLGSLNLG